MLICFSTLFITTSCKEVEDILDLSTKYADMVLEYESLLDENLKLQDENQELKSQLKTLEFLIKYPGGVIDGVDKIIELDDIILTVDKGVEGDALTVKNGAQVTIIDGIFNGGQTPFGGAGNTAIWCNGIDSKIIINDGIFYINGLAIDDEGNRDKGHIDLIYCTQGTIEINGGWFEGADDTVWLLNCKDTYYKDGTAKIIVKGGSFVNFDPSNCLSEGEGTNFVAEGYEVVVEEIKDETTSEYLYTLYTVVESTTIVQE